MMTVRKQSRSEVQDRLLTSHGGVRWTLGICLRHLARATLVETGFGSDNADVRRLVKKRISVLGLSFHAMNACLDCPEPLEKRGTSLYLDLQSTPKNGPHTLSLGHEGHSFGDPDVEMLQLTY